MLRIHRSIGPWNILFSFIYKLPLQRSGAGTSPGVRSQGPGKGGQFTEEPGFLAYYEICNAIKVNKKAKKYCVTISDVRKGKADGIREGLSVEPKGLSVTGYLCA